MLKKFNILNLTIIQQKLSILRKEELFGWIYSRKNNLFKNQLKAPSKDIFDFMKVSTGEKEMLYHYLFLEYKFIKR